LTAQATSIEIGSVDHLPPAQNPHVPPTYMPYLGDKHGTHKYDESVNERLTRQRDDAGITARTVV
jgi:hypothetical protein